MKKVYTLSQAFWKIFISVILISGTSWTGFFIYKGFLNFRAENEKYVIRALLQTGPEREALKTAYLAELLGLSYDRPINLYKISLAEAKKRLLACPLIKEVSLKRVPPGILYIDYAIRKPAAYLGDRSNASIDRDGLIIPFSPFFHPKKLPHFYLGIDPKNDLRYGERLDSEALKMAWNIVDYFRNHSSFRVKSLDFSKAYEESLGARKIIVLLEPQGEVALILNPSEPIFGINRFFAFAKSKAELIQGGTLLLDLRNPNIGIFQKGAEKI